MRFLICTDVAARGIDIRGIPFVINVTLPDDKQNYVHRIGRVGRAERMGLAISLVSKVKEKARILYNDIIIASYSLSHDHLNQPAAIYFSVESVDDENGNVLFFSTSVGTYVLQLRRREHYHFQL